MKKLLALIAIISIAPATLEAITLNPGDILVTDLATQSVIHVEPVTGAQSLVSSGGLLVNPFGVAVASNGDIVVALADPGAGSIIRVDPASGAQSVLSSGGDFNNLLGVAIDTNGDILVTDGGAGTLVRVDPTTGTQTIVSSGGFFGSPRDIAVDSTGDYLVVAHPPGLAGAVVRVDPATGAQSLLSSDGFLVGPSGIAIGSSGDIFVADSGSGKVIQVDNNKIFRVDSMTGARTTISDGGLLGGALRSVTVVLPASGPPDPVEGIAGLIGGVIQLNLQEGISNSLDAKLDSALDALQDLNENNDGAAVNKLEAFINAVSAQRGNKIPEADADELIAAAQAIIDQLTNG
jgi:hypothetical protein